MTLREAIALAVERAVAVRGCYDIWPDGDSSRSVNVAVAVDGSFESYLRDLGPPGGLLRRRGPLDAAAMGELGFRLHEQLWALGVAPYPGAGQSLVATLERLFSGPLEASLDGGAELWHDYSGLVPGRPAPAPHAPLTEHLRASIGLFEVDPDAAVVVHAGLPSRTRLEFFLAEPGVVGVHQGAEHPVEAFPEAAAALVGSEMPVYIELSSDLFLDEQ